MDASLAELSSIAGDGGYEMRYLNRSSRWGSSFGRSISPSTSRRSGSSSATVGRRGRESIVRSTLSGVFPSATRDTLTEKYLVHRTPLQSRTNRSPTPSRLHWKPNPRVGSAPLHRLHSAPDTHKATREHIHQVRHERQMLKKASNFSPTRIGRKLPWE